MKKTTQAATHSGLPLNEEFFQRLIVGLFHFLVISVPLFFTFNTSELFEFNKMVLTYALTALILSAWIGRMIVSGKIIFKRTYLDIPIFIFLISQLLSVIFSIHPYTSLLGYYSRFHGGLSSVITYIVLYFAFTANIEKKHIPSFLLSMSGAAVTVSVYAILEHFGHSFSCFMIDSGRDFGVNCWIQDVKNRVFATFGQPNWLAAYLIMLLPVTTVLALREYKKKLVAIYYALASTLYFVTLLFTQSRSGFLGAVVGMALVITMVIWKLWRIKNLTGFIQTTRTPLLILVISILASVAIFGTNYTPSLSAAFNKPQPTSVATPSAEGPVVNRLDIGGTDSGEIRKIVWAGALKVWQRYPIFGSGLETFGYSYYLDRPIEHNYVSEWDFLYNKAHNEFLNFLATTGIVGLLSYVLLLGYFCFYALRQSVLTPKGQQHRAFMLAALCGSIVALSISNFFGFSTVMVTVLMYVFFGLVDILTRKDTSVRVSTIELTNTSYLLLSATGLFCVFLLRIVFQYWHADVDYTKGKAYMDAGYFDQGAKLLQQAITENSQEATFYDELSQQYSAYAYPFAQQGKTEETKALMIAAEEVSDATLKLNPHQVNFYKTRARVFINLAQVDPKYLQKAKDTLLEARKLAPNDPKLVYNIGILEISMDAIPQGIQTLQEAIELKPNYESARVQLAAAYEKANEPEKALEQYQYILNNLNPSHQVALERVASISAELTPKKK